MNLPAPVKLSLTSGTRRRDVPSFTPAAAAFYPMPERDVATLLLRRFAAAQNPFGRCLLNLRLQHQRLRAEWFTHGSSFLKRIFDIAASFTLLILLSPLLLLIAALVWV